MISGSISDTLLVSSSIYYSNFLTLIVVFTNMSATPTVRAGGRWTDCGV